MKAFYNPISKLPLALALLLGLSLASCQREEIIPDKPAETEEPTKTEEVVYNGERVEINLEGAADLNFSEEGDPLRGASIKYKNEKGGTRYLLKNKPDATVRVYLKNGAGTINGTYDLPATVSQEDDNSPITIRIASSINLPNNAHFTHGSDWYISGVLLLDGRPQGKEATFPSIATNGTGYAKECTASNIVEEDFNLPVAFPWTKLEIPTDQTHVAKKTGLQYQPRVMMFKVRVGSNLRYDVRVHDLRFYTNDYMLGNLTYPNALPAGVPTVGEFIEPTEELMQPPIETDYVWQENLTSIPLKNAYENPEYKPASYASADLDEGYRPEDMNEGFPVLSGAKAGSNYYIVFAYPKKKPKGHKSINYFTLGVSHYTGQSFQEFKDDKTIIVSQTRRQGLTSTDIAAKQVRKLELKVESDPMLTELYLRRNNTLKINTGFLEMMNVNLDMAPLGKLRVVRVMYKNSKHSFFPNGDLRTAAAMPVFNVPGSDMEYHQRNLTTFNYKSGSPGTFTPPYQQNVLDEFTKANNSTWNRQTKSYVNGAQSYSGRLVRSVGIHSQYQAMNQDAIAVGSTYVMGMAGQTYSLDNLTLPFTSSSYLFWNAGYKLGFEIGNRVTVATRLFANNGQRNIYTEPMFNQLFNASGLRPANNSRYVAMHGYYALNDSKATKSQGLASTDINGGVMNAGVADAFLLVKELQNGNHIIVDMASVAHKDAFVKMKEQIEEGAEALDKHNLRLRSQRNVTAISTEFDRFIRKQLDEKLYQSIWKVLPGKMLRLYGSIGYRPEIEEYTWGANPTIEPVEAQRANNYTHMRTGTYTKYNNYFPEISRSPTSTVLDAEDDYDAVAERFDIGQAQEYIRFGTKRLPF